MGFAQTDTLRRGVEVCVATPGRLLNLINQMFISLKHIEYFVLDEAVRMLDMGVILVGKPLNTSSTLLKQ